MAILCRNLTHGLRIATNGRYFACCHTFNAPFRDKNGKPLIASTHTIDQALDSHSRQEMLKDFENDKRHPACKVCWDAEDAGFQSKRQRDNTFFQNFPERIGNKIFFLELNLGNTCNLACRICHVSASSKWRPYHRVHEPDFTDEQLDDYAKQFSRAFVDDSQVWNELLELLPTVKQVDVYGGEPMLMKKQWEILDFCVKNGFSKDQHMSFNTNGTIITDKYVEILSSFKHCRIGFSIDGVGDRFHYLRYPGDWNEVSSNISQWIEKTSHLPENVMMFELACTVSVLNVMYIFEIADYAFDNPIKIFVSFVYNPPYLSITNIPQDMKDKIIDYLEVEYNKRAVKVEEFNNPSYIKEYERRKQILRQAKKVIDTLKLPNTSDPVQWEEFKRQTQVLDKMRNENFAKTFPEAEEIFQVYGKGLTEENKFKHLL